MNISAQTNKTRTDAYVFTFHPNDFNDIERLKQLRNQIKYDNSKSNTKQYVKLQHRLGKDNPNAHLYRRGGPYYSYILSIAKEHAAYSDVYVYNRYN